jgi:hypothetical protein
MNLNRQSRKPDIRPLASIPNKEGMVIIGVRADGSEARLQVYVDDNGYHQVPGYAELVGWKMI